MDDGLLNPAHVSQGCALQEQSLHTVAVELDGLGSQVQGPGVPLAIKAVATETIDTNVGLQTPQRAVIHHVFGENDTFLPDFADSPSDDPGFRMLV